MVISHGVPVVENNVGKVGEFELKHGKARNCKTLGNFYLELTLNSGCYPEAALLWSGVTFALSMLKVLFQTAAITKLLKLHA